MNENQQAANKSPGREAPKCARLETVRQAINSATFAMQMTDSLEDYEQYVRNVRSLRSIAKSLGG